MSTTATQWPVEIVTLRALANATPDTGEGSRGHLRDSFAWDVEDDYRRAIEGDERVRDLYDDHPSLRRIAFMCRRDARDAAERWRAQQ